jgi:putative pyruvate formate lyase activating enzyme
MMNGIDSLPAYRQLLEAGEFEKRIEQASQLLEICAVCAWKCPVNRLIGQQGVCKTGRYARVYSYGAHHGEENPLRGWKGSGTIFFTGCNLRCQYCQNHEISQTNGGFEIGSQELASIMLDLQAAGCHNINLVSPSHVAPQILEAVLIATQQGLAIPLVYNTGGYDSLEMLHLLDGIIDIYMPDMKYADPQVARRYSKVRDYPSVNQAAVVEMHRQVGDLVINERGLATRGLLIRHLVLPGNLSGTDKVVRFIASELSNNTYLNLMAQYHPDYRAHLLPELNRRITPMEYRTAVQWAHEAGMTRLDDN